MAIEVRDFMQQEVFTVRPRLSVTELERSFLERRAGGFPVVDAGVLVGVVSRSDIVRALDIEHAFEGQISDYYAAGAVAGSGGDGASGEIGARVGARIEALKVADVMVRDVITVSPDEPLESAAEKFVEHGIHRLPVVDGGRLVGIVTSLDVIRLITSKQLVPA